MFPSSGLSPPEVEAWSHWLGAVTPIATTALGALTGWWMGRHERLAKIAQIERQHRKAVEEETAAVIDAVTRRFQTLIDGYEARVKDLMMEIHSLREEVKQLRHVLASAPAQSEPKST